MLPREWMQTPEGKELWDEFFSKPTKTPKTTKQKITPHTHQTIPTSTCNLEELIQDKKDDIQIETIAKQTTQNAEEEHPKTLADLKPAGLHDIVTYFQNKGVVGEEALVVGSYLALSNNISFGVEGYSGSGKTFLVDKLIDLVNKDDLYRAELSSKMAMFYDKDKVNAANLIYIPELQKALREKNSPVTEIVKNITEGKDAKRIVTGKDLNGSEEFVINKDKTIIYTLALENHFKKDNEASRRFMRFITDSSPEHLESIHQHKANARLEIDKKEDNEERAKRLSNHLNTLRNLSVQVIDPFAEYLQAFIPKTQKSVGYIDHYYNLVDACTRFHFSNREHFAINGQEYLLANLEDHYHVHSMYYNEFIKTLDELSLQSKKSNVSQDIDWKRCFQQGREKLYANKAIAEATENDASLLKNWEQAQIRQEAIYTKNYKTGELFLLVEDIAIKENDTIS